MKRKIIFFMLLSSTLQVIAQQKLEGVFDDFGKLIPKSKNIIMMPFIDGLAPFMLHGGNPRDNYNNKVGFLDTNMHIVMKTSYLNCSYFYHGYAVIQDSLLNYGLIDKYGKIIIPVIYNGIAPCDNGLYLLFDKNYKIALVTAGGKIIVPPGKYEGLAHEPEFTTISSVCGTGYAFNWTLLNNNYHINFKKFIGVKAGKIWAIIDSSGNEIMRKRLTWIGGFNNQYAPFSIGKKQGVIDTAGNVIIPPKYVSVHVIDKGLVLASRGRKMGLLSTSNNVLIPFKYDDIKRINDSAFLASNKGMHGIVNIQNQMIVPMGNYVIEKFGSGYVVSNYLDGDSKKRLLNGDGKQITDLVGNFYDDQPRAFYQGIDNDFLIYNKTDKIFHNYPKLQYKKIGNNFDDHTAIIYYRANKWGLIDTNGTEVTGAIFDDVDFTTYPGYYRNYTAVKIHNKWGVVNNSGKCILNCGYDEIHVATFGLIVRKGDKYGIFNKQLKAITPFAYDEILLNYRPHSLYNSPNNRDYDEIINQNDYYFAARIDKTWGMLDQCGNALTSFKFNLAPRFKSSNDLYIYSANGKQGAINIYGQDVLAETCDAIKRDDEPRKPTKFILKKGSHYGMMNTNGKIEVPVIYDELKRLPYYFDNDTWFVVKRQGSVGLLDSEGKVRIACIYSKIRLDKDRQTCFLIAAKNNHYGIIDLSGNTIKPFIYDRIEAMPNHLYNAVLNQKHIWLNENLAEVSPPIDK